jgi:glutamate-ammonia-ligase adenylyltransferase
VAGDRAAGASYCRVIQDLIFQDADKAALGRDILEMRKRMEEELGKESATHYNIKQGAGGLVDIEFLVQYLQLLHGKRRPRLRVPGTYDALRALRASKKEKLLDEEEHRVLLGAYLFLRRLESRMRIVSNQATSELSRNPAELHALARRMGYGDDEASAGRKLLSDYEMFSKQVRSVFDKGFR